MKSNFTHIRISNNTKEHLNNFRATGQSYDGLVRELLWLAYNYLRPPNPILPGDEVGMKPEKLGEMKPWR